MKGFPEFSEEYFLQFSEKPVEILPFDQKTLEIADDYVRRIEDILSGLEVEVSVRGAVAFKISGKGDVEVGIYTAEGDWEEVIARLTDFFGEPKKMEAEYVRFNDRYEKFHIEISAMRGGTAKIDRTLYRFFYANPSYISEYEEVKKKYSYSKREYQRQKDKFFRGVFENIPENY